MLLINDLFSTIKEARDTIIRYILDKGESYKVYKSDSHRYIIIYKDPVYNSESKPLCSRRKVLLFLLLIYKSC